MKRLGFFILLIGLVYPATVFAQNKALSLEGDEGYVSSNSAAHNITGDLTVELKMGIPLFNWNEIPLAKKLDNKNTNKTDMVVKIAKNFAFFSKIFLLFITKQKKIGIK